MESRIKGRVLSIIVAGAMIASTSTALAVTTKPTPKPSVKATKKTTTKATPKVTKKATPKATKKVTTTKAKAKTIPKKTVIKKRTVITKKTVTVKPTPTPSFPPKGFSNPAKGEIYFKSPTSSELLGILSAAAALSEQVKNCASFACGAVNVASINGCTWWEITSTVYGPLSATDPTLVPYGNLRTTAKATNPKQIVTVLLISTEPLKPNINVGKINISCYHSPVTEKIPTNTYTPNTPTPSATPTTNTN